MTAAAPEPSTEVLRRPTAALLVVLAVTFLALALWFPRQILVGSLYSGAVALLLALGALAVWRPPGSRAKPVTALGQGQVLVVQRVLTGLAWAFPVVLHGYAVLAACLIGHWPSYGRPDPKDLELPTLHGLVSGGLLVTVGAILVWALAFPLFVYFADARGLRRCALGFAAAVGVTLVTLFVDPLGVFEWWAD